MNTAKTPRQAWHAHAGRIARMLGRGAIPPEVGERMIINLVERRLMKLHKEHVLYLCTVPLAPEDPNQPRTEVRCASESTQPTTDPESARPGTTPLAGLSTGVATKRREVDR